MTDYDEKVCACALGHIFGYEPKYSAELVRRLGSAKAVFALDRGELEALFGPYSKYVPMIGEKALEDADRELKSLFCRGFQYLAYMENGYPSLLKESDDPPSGLYVRSSTDAFSIFSQRPSVSIVGTRNISLYGKEWCQKIVAALASAQRPPMIVSGLALGVDIAAHMAALACNLPTIAVMATGVETVYPSMHYAAAAKIASAPGSALVTDYPPGTSPVAVNFLRRNRIIAGMSGATILVESAIKGGGMMTARLASGYGRDVYVLPGRIEDRFSAGCNELLREKIAEPITDPAMLPELLDLGKSGNHQTIPADTRVRTCYAEKVPLDEMERLLSVFNAVRKRRGVTVDELCGICDLNYQEVSSCVCRLESDSFIETDLLGRCAVCLRV